ncbi:MAG TPA: TolC family protein [Candidatus Binatia bacterium]|jgi:outer membrane protein TolC|nr:TolC family protein [Candidatus Binatia bacterium]
MRSKSAAISILIAALSLSSNAFGVPTYTIEQAVAVAEEHNPEILIARKKVQGARGGVIEARSGFLPWLTSNGLVDKRQTQSETNLRQEDYNVTLKLEQNLYTGGAVTSQMAIARLNLEKQNYELQEIATRVAMDVRIAFNELLLNRAKVRVRQDSVRVLDEELKSQQQSFSAGIVSNLNVQRAEVALANERPELFNAQTQLKNSYLRLGDLFGTEVNPRDERGPFEVSGELQYQPNHPDLNDCLARADANRAVIKARQKDIEIEDQQYILDRSAMRPHVRAFSGYEVYSERDPDVGPEFNYGGVVGINATWNIFDGYATKGRMQATRARREAAVQALAAARRSVASEVRSAFFDFQQADRVLETETSNVQAADEALDIAKSNFAAGLGTQLDILQAASDVTRTRTTRLSAIYLHNVALARLAHACGSSAEALDFGSKIESAKKANRNATQAADVAHPPEKLSKR